MKSMTLLFDKIRNKINMYNIGLIYIIYHSFKNILIKWTLKFGDFDFKILTECDTKYIYSLIFLSWIHVSTLTFALYHIKC